MAPGGHPNDSRLRTRWVKSEAVQEYLALAEKNAGTPSAREAALWEFGHVFFDRGNKYKKIAWDWLEPLLLLVAIAARCTAAGLSRLFRGPAKADIALCAIIEVFTLFGLVMDLYFKVRARKFTFRWQVIVTICKLTLVATNMTSTMYSGIREVGYDLSVPWATAKCVAEACTALAATTKLCKLGKRLYANEGRRGTAKVVLWDEPNSKLEWELVPDDYKLWAERILYQMEIDRIHIYHQERFTILQDFVRDYHGTLL